MYSGDNNLIRTCTGNEIDRIMLIPPNRKLKIELVNKNALN